MTTVDARVEAPSRRRQLRSGFWAVAYALLIVMAFATCPAPCTVSTESEIISPPS
jgi:hypothetical protein